MVRTSSQSETSNAPLVTDLDSTLQSSSSVLKSKRSVSFNLPAAEHLRKIRDQKARDLRSSSPDSSAVNSPAGNVSEDEEEEEQGHTQKHEQTRRRFNPMLVLENSGSVARDHLASERTFLAYVRTSLAIASTGVALVQLFTVSSTANTGSKIQTYARPLGGASVCLGIIVLLVGIFRYFTVQHALTQGTFPVARLMMAAITIVLAAIITTVFATLIAGHR